MTDKNTMQKDPPVIIDAAYYDRLNSMANSFLRRSPDAAERLLEEISRADILQSEEIPPHVVNLGSQVTYRDETTGSTRTIYLVWPFEADIEQNKISVLTPVGAALIGLAEGASIGWETNSGEARQLTVLKVKH